MTFPFKFGSGLHQATTAITMYAQTQNFRAAAHIFRAARPECSRRAQHKRFLMFFNILLTTLETGMNYGAPNMANTSGDADLLSAKREGAVGISLNRTSRNQKWGDVFP